MKKLLNFEVGKCTGCGSCITTCPTKAIKADKINLKFDFDKCTLCLDCLEICPKDAISLSESGRCSSVLKSVDADKSAKDWIFSKI